MQVTGPFDTEILDVLPSTVKFICHNGVGYDNIDIATCTKKGIEVSNTPGEANHATADLAILLMLCALRRLWPALSAIREADHPLGKWRGKTELGHNPQGKVLGILGMGGIGTEVARRAKAFGMSVIYHNRNKASPELEGAEYVTFESLLSRSDVISVHCPLTEDTIHIIGESEFKKMKQGVVIINTARGALVDEKALVAALRNKKVAAAGLDVFENEPEIESALREHPSVILLPHVGTLTYETQENMERLTLDNLKSCLHTGDLLTKVPEQRNVTR
ncbi:D-3-phosphoglycerate dehydrogenase [[Emmonsia] crescens]|uniref:D-3-phosphoglycerate dehydrogenase n=1 Tax=[Emmonsia] crescens TaxID=73230 RepID=A0A0G2IDJ7_9EURO|nr:D-3-phosphoglycerate dehydrogenase [Emmonsia crescens UAMH 3008]